MRALLDTHAFLWWITDDDRLSMPARAAIGDEGSEILLSVVSAWEMTTKAAMGRLDLQEPVRKLVPAAIEANAFGVLPIHLRHTLRLDGLPPLHRDPFDRMLVAQAIEEDLALITRDRRLSGYPVRIVW